MKRKFSQKEIEFMIRCDRYKVLSKMCFILSATAFIWTFFCCLLIVAQKLGVVVYINN